MADPVSLISLAVTIVAAAMPFIVPVGTRTEFQTVPAFRFAHGNDLGGGGWLGGVQGRVERNAAIFGTTFHSQWIEHDSSQANQYDEPHSWFGWLNGASPASGPAKWIDYAASPGGGRMCLVRFDYRLDNARVGFGKNGGSFPFGLVARIHNAPWYHAGYVKWNKRNSKYEWQICGWLADPNWSVLDASHTWKTAPTTYWFDVPHFNNLASAYDSGDWAWFDALWKSVKSMCGPKYNTWLNRRDSKQKKIEWNNIVIGSAPASELCNSESSWGPSYFSTSENQFCDMDTKTLYNVTLDSLQLKQRRFKIKQSSKNFEKYAKFQSKILENRLVTLEELWKQPKDNISKITNGTLTE